MRSLVVEDELTTRILLSRILSRYGPCDVAVNGSEAVEASRQAHEKGEPYDLMTLDLLLPELEGHSALEQIREAERRAGIGFLQGTRVLAITGIEDVRTVAALYKAGCEAYLLKPVNEDMLVEKLIALRLV